MSGGKYILDEDGNPVEEKDLLVWAAWLETSEDRKIAYDVINDEVSVSTIFIGLDYAMDGGDPLLFETMIMGGKHDREMWRYTTREQALAGHKSAKELVEGGQ